MTKHVIVKHRSPFSYVALTFALSIPFWVAGALSQQQLLPGLPVSALMIVAPATAALILVYRENKIAGVVALLKRAFDFERVHAKRWCVPTFLLMPGIMLASYVVMLLSGVTLPNPQFTISTITVLFALFFVAALCEELGWAGYLTDPLQGRFGALGGAVLLGIVWAVWHFIPLFEARRSLAWIAWWSLGTVTSRVIMSWLYNNTGGSVFVAAIFHAMINLTWQLFPAHGTYSYYDPRVTGLVTLAVALFVVIWWWPRTLVRDRSPSEAA